MSPDADDLEQVVVLGLRVVLVVDPDVHLAVLVDGLLDDQVVAVDQQLAVAVVHQSFDVDFLFDGKRFLGFIGGYVEYLLLIFDRVAGVLV